MTRVVIVGAGKGGGGHPTESHHVMARVDHFKELEKRASDGFGEERH